MQNPIFINDDIRQQMMRGRIERSRFMTKFFLDLFHLPARIAEKLRALLVRTNHHDRATPRDFKPTRL
ncbi:hypothetical protein [Aestuariispira insulae]|uniref:Uncharacterized protein n=1 Tax=Aestuariispira insulae TaxID=1461337 RepID=A0A3D9HS74_9PROT|nr:hypothetical protein [Aestuariispira insulae]RED52363.1 hypothetical protein DFP90_102384 [Aestuariispira insulae]